MSHIDGIDDGVGYGVSGRSDRAPITGDGVIGFTNWGDSVHGVHGPTQVGSAVRGDSVFTPGVTGFSSSSYGMLAVGRVGIWARGIEGGVRGESAGNTGVEGWSRSYFGVWGESEDFTGVIGMAGSQGVQYPPDEEPIGVVGNSIAAVNGIGVYGIARSAGWAGYFEGNVKITGRTELSGIFSKIDHPLDPDNKYLYHSIVESADMKNLYDGVVALDDKGEAEVELPDWFGALNRDFHYQLTAIGAPGPNLHIEEEISEDNTKQTKSSRFKIAGGASGMKVSWQVTGIRKDAWANAHRIQLEEDKPDKERGRFHPKIKREIPISD